MSERIWCLTVSGSNDVFNDKGCPDDYIDYETYYNFESLDDLLDFIALHEKFATDSHQYKIQII